MISRTGAEGIQSIVGVGGIVMEQKELVSLRAEREQKRIADARVTPSHVRGVILIAELAVVDKQRGSPRQREAGDPIILRDRKGLPKRWLMVRQIGDRGLALVDAVPERHAAVKDPRSLDPRGADLAAVKGELAKAHARRELADLDWRERAREVTSEHVT